MPAARGSRQTLKAVKEVTFGTTPTAPVLLELPLVSFNRNFNRSVIRSNQIRSHPYTDKLMKGELSADFDLSVELQDDTYDVLLDVMCGTTTWSSNVLKVSDGLQGISFEASAGDLSLHDQFAGGMLSSMEVNFPAEANGVVTANFSGMAKTVTMDAASSVVGAGSVTAAPSVDPFVFGDAVCTVAGASRPITSLNFRLERQVDPLLVLGSFTPREYVPSTVTLTGQVTIPLEANTESAQLAAFSDIAISASARDAAGTGFRTFLIPAVKFGRMGRQIQDRGVILQVIDFEAKYDSGIASIMSITRSA